MLALGAGVATARAAGGEQFAEVRAKVAEASVLVDEAVAAAAGGDRERGLRRRPHRLPRSLRVAEIPLRLRNPTWCSTSSSVRGASQRRSETAPRWARCAAARSTRLRGPRSTSTARSTDKGVAAPAVAFAFSFTILFREGLEAVLLIAILLGSLEAGAGQQLPPAARLGHRRRGRSPRPRHLRARGFVIDDRAGRARAAGGGHRAARGRDAVRGHLLARLAARAPALDGVHARPRLGGDRRRRRASPSPALGFTAVYREGFETVLFYQALALFAEGLIALGRARDRGRRAALAVVAYAILRLGKRLPLKPMLMTARDAAARALGRLRRQRGPLAAGGRLDRRRRRSTASWARLPIFLAELTGIHPTRRASFVQARAARRLRRSARSTCSSSGRPPPPRRVALARTQ